CRLVVIDPVGSFIGGINTHKESDVRQVLEPLALMAERTGVCVLLVSHLNKNSQAQAHQRVGGSIAFINQVRLAWLLALDPESPERRVLTRLKGNLGRDIGGLAFSITDDGHEEQSRIEWESDPVFCTADQLLSVPTDPQHRRKSRGQECAEWLSDALRSGPMLVEEVQELAERAGFKASMLNRTKRTLRVESRKREGAADSQWEWMLPGQGAQLGVETTN
ncbi:MAG: AAA family ATPase, partial [Planctomycetaceae bacterium]|nr:AAA family ATPase [Planctomycetaceae bacterium]